MTLEPLIADFVRQFVTRSGGSYQPCCADPTTELNNGGKAPVTGNGIPGGVVAACYHYPFDKSRGDTTNHVTVDNSSIPPPPFSPPVDDTVRTLVIWLTAPGGCGAPVSAIDDISGNPTQAVTITSLGANISYAFLPALWANGLAWSSPVGTETIQPAGYCIVAWAIKVGTSTAPIYVYLDPPRNHDDPSVFGVVDENGNINYFTDDSAQPSPALRTGGTLYTINP